MVSENALPLNSRPYGIYFRPKVVQNNDGLFVLWINHLANASSPLEAYTAAGSESFSCVP